MRLLILSDLHLEVWRDDAPAIDLAASRPDAVILAGDIDTGSNAIAWAARTFGALPVLYVHGNHEGYGHQLEHMQDAVRDACASANAHGAHIRLLDGDSVVLDGVRFLGITLWTDFLLFGAQRQAEALSAAQNYMPDYKRISTGGDAPRLLCAADTAQLHAQHKAWLAQQLAQPFAGKTVVITHMAPSMLSVEEQYASNLGSPAFASHLDELVAQADLWVHGHMHASLDYRIQDCRVVCNPCGYKRPDGTPENERFDPGFIVELESPA
ncbi:metallophosphoesterase family protein [Janthinobacterium sp. SUN118]|uniref:metallophosphoesterase family protein n=1 Tax=Janthinobacterium sp. SUN118 TaxID=3004100 RepID=UPI0025AFE36B|nr:metallophosphoesterase family protein [Janthinobacterium sp. SUN118]MDN2710996.1 metallophosphoesterase family protein [Janthinobacterium sp. SUN118]